MNARPSCDIDIDCLDRNDILSKIPHIVASRYQNNELVKHNTGVYLQNIPCNQITNISTIDYQTAEQRGYFKIDFLNVSAYKGVRDEAHLSELVNTPPMWELLMHEEFVNMVFHLNGHCAILKITQPKSIEQLAAVLAMIRPAKKYLIGKDWDTIFKEVWAKPLNNEYYFKRSHSFSYALAVIVHMNLICEKINAGELSLSGDS